MELWNPASYDALRRQLIPSFDLLYESAADAVAFVLGRFRAHRAGPARILDLGAGTGLLSAAIRTRLPDCELVLVDQSERMLDVARQRFSDDRNVGFLNGRLEDSLPNKPYDAVVSALAIHHLPHEGKRKLFSEIRDSLRPGGVFLNVEQVAAPSERLEILYDQRHEHHVQVSGTAPEEWAAGRERMKFDICANLAAQLEWLRESGFVDVDCLAKDCRFATYLGLVDTSTMGDAEPTAG